VQSAAYTSGSPLVGRPPAATPSPSSARATASSATPAAVSPSPTVPAKPAPVSSVPAGLAVLPVAGYTGSASQAITVVAPAMGATQARLQAWNRGAGGWVRYGPEVTAWLGSAGLTSNAREGFSGTPIGSFPLTHAFGNYADPGTRLPYFQAGPEDWWSGDVGSRTYNTHQHCAAADCPFDTGQSENLHDAGSAYGYAVVIDYNTAPVVAGKGSAFFLHLSQDHPTEGCVSISQEALVRIMRWLDPSRRPRIIMGVG
jgi:L,D-peptidoglycan transpeptidase YkuD (ErfK/YbiS/YcfS/YnhG family)